MSEPPKQDAAEELLSDVISAGGQLTIPAGEADEQRLGWLVRATMTSKNRPRGKRLHVYPQGPWHAPTSYEVRFIDHLDELAEEAKPVPIPERIGRYHPAARAYRDDKEWHEVTPDHLARAVRILHAVATEAERRGAEVLPKTAWRELGADARSRERRAHLFVKTNHGIYTVQVKEKPGPGPNRVEPRRWNERKTQPEWIDRRGWEFISTGKLELIINGPGMPYNGTRYPDTRSGTVEDKLPEAFRSLDIARFEVEARLNRQRKDEEEREQRWLAAIETAKRRYALHTKW